MPDGQEVSGDEMMKKVVEELLPRLMKECGLGEIVGSVESVSGGFMHRMYKVTTERGIYAVKHLNTEIMKKQILLI